MEEWKDVEGYELLYQVSNEEASFSRTIPPRFKLC